MNDGGSASPVVQANRLGHITDGMSLRQWFAGMALPGVMSIALDNARHGIVRSDESMARDCYSIADAMLKERDK